jgi:hypothetical protein
MGFMIFSSNAVILIRRNANVITAEFGSGNNFITRPAESRLKNQAPSMG